ncbi:transcriptional regulator [Sphingorhabdus lutea]|uniref:Transcriptional regulator n=2 Tax=Sphingorhabdus lutea TaxID=1913578 RepID=A0A1L3JDB2_9SPHN|nr:transcriptional regulator [Sphingorhabdus lutea]
MFSIGSLSKKTGVKIPTIRYYEDAGLLDAPERSAGNQRCYTSSALERLAFIKNARELGLSLDAISSLIELSAQPMSKCADADKIVQQQLHDTKRKIARLKRLERELSRMSKSCNSDKVANCAIIESLSEPLALQARD